MLGENMKILGLLGNPHNWKQFIYVSQVSNIESF